MPPQDEGRGEQQHGRTQQLNERHRERRTGKAERAACEAVAERHLQDRREEVDDHRQPHAALRIEEGRHVNVDGDARQPHQPDPDEALGVGDHRAGLTRGRQQRARERSERQREADHGNSMDRKHTHEHHADTDVIPCAVGL